MNERTIWVHQFVDLDAVTSVWAAKTFVSGFKDARVRFVPANWDGDGMGPDDIAVDIEAGGKGIKGRKEKDGTTHSAFAEIMELYAPFQDQDMLSHLIRYVDLQDTKGNVVKELVGQYIPKDGLHAVIAGSISVFLRGLQTYFEMDDAPVVEIMLKGLSGIREMEYSRKRARVEADQATILPGAKVALVEDAKERSVNSVLFSRGIRVVVYQNGNDIGLSRNPRETIRMDHPRLKAIVEQAGELHEWFAHPAGFLFCRGSWKSPAKTPSKVDPRKLGDAVNDLLSHT